MTQQRKTLIEELDKRKKDVLIGTGIWLIGIAVVILYIVGEI